MSDIKITQSSRAVNEFLANSVKNYENRTDSEQSIFDMPNEEGGSLVDQNVAKRHSDKTDLRFDNQYWNNTDAQKVDSWRKWSASDGSNLICEKYQYDDGSYSIVYKAPFGPLTRLIRGEDAEIIGIEDYDNNGKILTKSSSDSSFGWNVTTFDENNNPDISLTYTHHKTGNYTTLKDNDGTGTKQKEVHRYNSVIRSFLKDVTNIAEQFIKGPEQEISEEEYRRINNPEIQT